MLNLYPGTLQINIIVPLSHERTLTVFEWYFVDPGTPESWNALQASIEFSDEVQHGEDEADYPLQLIRQQDFTTCVETSPPGGVQK